MTDNRTIKKINSCIRRIARGSSAALEELFALTKKQLLIVAKSYLWDKSKAEDVLGDSYRKAVRGAKSFDSKRNGYNWLYEIVKNTALNQNERDKFAFFRLLPQRLARRGEELRCRRFPVVALR